MMRIIRLTLGSIFAVLGAYAAVMIYLQAPLAGVIVGILSACLILPILIYRATHPDLERRKEIGVRQARSVVLREEGEIRGAPPAKA